jgi:heme exporter protein C
VGTVTASETMRRRLTGWDVAALLLNLTAVGAMALVMWAALLYARPAVNLAGDEQIAQRIFYIHMGCNIGALAGFLCSLVGSGLYLFTRHLDWDRVAQAGVEVGTLFGCGTILTGIFWAKPAWNTYWTWDPRLTTATITVLLYVAYLLFRNGIDNRHTRARFGSIYAVFAFLSVPLTYYSARWFRSIHPVVFGGSNPEAQGDFETIGPTMSQTLSIAMVGFLVLYVALMWLRWRQLRVADRLEELREELET